MRELRTGTGRPRMVATGAAVCALVGAIMLTACTAAPVHQVTTSPTPPATASATPAPPIALVLAPDKGAADNLEYFTSISNKVAADDPEAGGRAFIDALVAGGFDKTAMQVTADRTSVDLAADSVQFSVQFNGECLIGQFGPASGGVHTMVAPLLGTGTCLVGSTRQIDW